MTTGFDRAQAAYDAATPGEPGAGAEDGYDAYLALFQADLLAGYGEHMIDVAAGKSDPMTWDEYLVDCEEPMEFGDWLAEEAEDRYDEAMEIRAQQRQEATWV